MLFREMESQNVHFYLCIEDKSSMSGCSKGYSTKQKPQAVFLTLSRPMMILLTSPHLANNS